jgi:hypothetical protein
MRTKILPEPEDEEMGINTDKRAAVFTAKHAKHAKDITLNR